MNSSFVWFCRECKVKGSMFGDSLSDNLLATMEHNVSSPDCGDLPRIARMGEIGVDKEISSFVDWEDN